MELREKAKRAIEKNKKYFIIFGVIWVLIVVVGVATAVCGIVDAKGQGSQSLAIFFESFGAAIKNPFGNFFRMFTPTYFFAFLNGLVMFTAIYILFLVIGFIKSAPKHEYSDIEHGSSRMG